MENGMKKWELAAAIVLGSMTMSHALHAEDLKEGDKLQTLTNLHPDPDKKLLYTMNYQQAGLIPVCSDIVVTGVGRQDLKFEYQGTTYRMEYEKHTKSAGVSFQDAAKSFFGPSCDNAKLKSLSKVDQEGVKAGKPRVGMSKDGVHFAMGRPPHHANTNLDGNYWLYWQNRFGKTGVEFDDKGKVSLIK